MTPWVVDPSALHATDWAACGPRVGHSWFKENGRETTVSLRDTAPTTQENTFSNELHLE